MSQPTRPWTLIAAFTTDDMRDKCMAEVGQALSDAKTYRTELTDGRPALGIEHPYQQPLVPLLSHIPTKYQIVSISLYLGS